LRFCRQCEKLVSCLNDEQLGRLFRHIFTWLNDGSLDLQKEEQLVESDILLAFRFMRMQINIDIKKYQQLCEKRKEAANKRWAKNDADANAFFAMHNKNKNNNKNENKNKNKNENKNKNKNEINKESLVDSLRRDSSSSSAVSGDANGGEEDEEDNFSRMIKEKFMPWWNQLIKDYESNIKPLRIMTEKRIERLRQICDTYGKDILFEACRKAINSPFLNGRNAKNRFIATFDWIIDEKNFLNVLENNFYNK
jgi:hypothetical protein